MQPTQTNLFAASTYQNQNQLNSVYQSQRPQGNQSFQIQMMPLPQQKIMYNSYSHPLPQQQYQNVPQPSLGQQFVSNNLNYQTYQQEPQNSIYQQNNSMTAQTRFQPQSVDNYQYSVGTEQNQQAPQIIQLQVQLPTQPGTFRPSSDFDQTNKGDFETDNLQQSFEKHKLIRREVIVKKGINPIARYNSCIDVYNLKINQVNGIVLRKVPSSQNMSMYFDFYIYFMRWASKFTCKVIKAQLKDEEDRTNKDK